MRRIRSLIVEIHPPNLRAAGLEAAVRDLLAPLHAHGVETDLTVADDVALPEDVELLFYRAAGEALRNAERHAGARRVQVDIGAENGRARLVVRDDGAGFAVEDRERRRAEGHVGLTLLEELAARAGGTLRVESQPGAGTTFTLEAPL